MTLHAEASSASLEGKQAPWLQFQTEKPEQLAEDRQ